MDTRASDSDAFMGDVFDLIGRARPHHIMDGFPVISWRHLLQAKSKLTPGRAVGTDGLNAEVVQCLSMRGMLLLWCIFNVTASASTSPKTRSLSTAACLPKERAMQKAVRQFAPGVLRRDVGQSLQCIPETRGTGQNPQRHQILTVAVLRVVPTTTTNHPWLTLLMRGCGAQ